MKILSFLSPLLLLVSCANVSTTSINVTAIGKSGLKLVSSTHLTLPVAPVIGTTTSGQKIQLGGFSGLVFKEEKDGELIFQTHTDRGPNGYNIDKDRPFLLPDFSPEIVTIKPRLKEKNLIIFN